MTDNGIQFAEPPHNRNIICSRPMRFDMICEGQLGFATGLRTAAGGIEHRVTNPNHPWTNGRVERMNGKIKDATVKRFHYEATISCERISLTSWQPITSPEG